MRGVKYNKRRGGPSKNEPIREAGPSGRFGEISQEITIAKLAPAQSDVLTLPYNWYRAVSGWDAATLRES